LLTYRLDVPQEGRITHLSSARSPLIDFRLAMIPTSHGLRCAIRLPAELTAPHTLEQLGHPASVLGDLYDFAKTDSGMLLVVGPAGSGKTTTIYALLKHNGGVTPGLSIIALEDPIERHVAGITQIEVKPFGELTYERALRRTGIGSGTEEAHRALTHGYRARGGTGRRRPRGASSGTGPRISRRSKPNRIDFRGDEFSVAILCRAFLENDGNARCCGGADDDDLAWGDRADCGLGAFSADAAAR